MTAEELRIGDVIYLNSGSPPLTVINPSDGNCQVTVVWLAENKIQAAAFPAVCFQRTPVLETSATKQGDEQ
jgi:hypothetical protein